MPEVTRLSKRLLNKPLITHDSVLETFGVCIVLLLVVSAKAAVADTFITSNVTVRKFP